MDMLIAIKTEAERWQNRDLSQIAYHDNDRLRVMICKSDGWVLAGALPGTKMQRSCQLRELHEAGLIDRGVDLCSRKNARQIIPVEPNDPERKVYARLTAMGHEKLGVRMSDQGA